MEWNGQFRMKAEYAGVFIRAYPKKRRVLLASLPQSSIGQPRKRIAGLKN
jgi:hypothetical protein